VNRFKVHLCTICGEERSGNQVRFLVVENTWEDKLTVLEWNEELASRAGIQVACSIGHVEELVIHWMTTGRLDYPFARTTLGAATWRNLVSPGSRVDLSGGRILGELSIHRESIERILMHNPESLRGILLALLDALHRETSGKIRMNLPLDAEANQQEELCTASSDPKN
jgi:hypothetical protein